MGTWGTGIYSNDTAGDVRDACKDIFAFYDVEEGNQKLFDFFKEVLQQEYIDNDYASFWYALSDWQWKHGMLTEYVKNKTVELLSGYAGIKEWEESGNVKDVIKRKKVLDSLKTQLEKPQPPVKKPKLSLVKPKHKPGDIIIFKATEYVDEWDSSWHIENFRPPFMFASKLISNSKSENINGYDAHGKYMAILCIDSQKESHSEYITGAFDEYSVYVWYNYLSEVKPSVEQLSFCGFLPMVDWILKDFNRGITDSISWIYQFTLMAESFKANSYIEFENKKCRNKNEVNRFHQLFANKKYSKDYFGGFDLCGMFNTAFEEKNRMDLLNLKIDDLLDPKVKNPDFLTPSEIDEAYKKYMNRLSD